MNATKYSTLLDTLKSEILSGKYLSNAPFPSVRALIGRFKLSDRTVRHALDELFAQGLISRKQGRGTFVTSQAMSRKIGLMVPGMAYSEFFPPIVGEISRLSQKENYNLMFGDVWSKSPDRRVLLAKKLTRELVAQRVAGVLYQPLELVDDVERVNRDILSVFDRAGIPVVIIDNDFKFAPHRSGYAYDVVGIDNVAAGTLVGEYLSGLGVRRVAFQKRPKCASSVNDRWRGVASVPLFGDSSLRTSVLISEPDDKNAVRRHLRRFNPDAFVCGNDAAAVVLKQTLEGLGKHVPDDVMLVGFDDVKFAKIVTPQLTTICQPCEKIAETAFYRLLDRVKNPALTPVKISLPVNLVVRGSTARAVRKKKGGRKR